MKHNKPYCICSLDYFGVYYNLKYDGCNSNSCLNNGTCLPTYDPSDEFPFVCLCSERFSGYQCRDEKASLHIKLNMTKTLKARAALVQFYTHNLRGLVLIILHQQIYNGLSPSIKYYYPNMYAPPLGTLKIYDDTSSPQYFLIYSLFQSKINITSTP